MNRMSNMKKQAIDKLPPEELLGQFPNIPGIGTPPQQGDDQSQQTIPPIDIDDIDPITGMPKSKPLTWNNKYHVKTDSTEFIVELTPSIVKKPMQAPPTQDEQMPEADVTNSGADVNALKDWYEQMMGKDKQVGSGDEKGTVEPEEQADEGIKDTGNEQQLGKQSSLQKNAAEPPLPKEPGIEHSNAQMPCKICPNYQTADNSCTQNLEPEKVQASGKCSWLNKFFGEMLEDSKVDLNPFEDQKGPFKRLTDPRSMTEDADMKRSNPNQSGGGQNAPSTGGGTAAIYASQKFKKEKLKDIWS